MDHPLPWLRYLNAGDLGDSAVRFDGMKVESVSGGNLGRVDGFIVDASSGRPYHVVVDAGGWFKSKRFLLPVGHVGLTGGDDKGRLVANLAKEHIDRYPGFDLDEFEKLTDTDIERMNGEMASACCPSETADRSSTGSMFDSWSHYRAPSWWDADFYRPDRADESARSMSGMTRK
jgi:PRC-barrel domain protein